MRTRPRGPAARGTGNQGGPGHSGPGTRGRCMGDRRQAVGARGAATRKPASYRHSRVAGTAGLPDGRAAGMAGAPERPGPRDGRGPGQPGSPAQGPPGAAGDRASLCAPRGAGGRPRSSLRTRGERTGTPAEPSDLISGADTAVPEERRPGAAGGEHRAYDWRRSPGPARAAGQGRHRYPERPSVALRDETLAGGRAAAADPAVAVRSSGPATEHRE